MLLLSIPGAASALTHVPGTTYTSSVTWTQAGSPYVLDGNVSVGAAATLTIEPGVEVRFAGSTARALYVTGRIAAVGQAEAPITFTSAQGAAGSGAAGQYRGVTVMSGAAGSEFAYVRFRFGASGSGGFHGYGALDIQSGSSVVVRDSLFEDNAYSAIKVSANSKVTALRNTLVRNGNGLSVLNGELVLRDSIVSDNADAGVFFNITSGTTRPGSVIVGNDLTRNGRYGINLQAYCTNPLSTFPRGSRNNIYDNGSPPSAVDGSGLYTLYKCVALPVDWSDNYWGPSFLNLYEPHRNAPCPDNPALIGMAGPSQPGGWLAFVSEAGWEDNKWRPGPISTRAELTQSLSGERHCGMIPIVQYVVNSFHVAPGDVQPTYMPDHMPVPAGSDLYGGPSAASPGVVKSECGDPVNCVTGNLHESAIDLVIPGRNGGLSFARTYNSQAAATGQASVLGRGWTFTFGDRLVVDAQSGNATVFSDQGQTTRFESNGDGTYTAPAWVQATLIKNADGSFDYRLPSRQRMRFAADGSLQWVDEPHGDRTTLTYSAGRLVTITDPTERTLSFDYDADGRVARITDPAGREVEYGYDVDGRLTSVVDVGDGVARYSYDGRHRLKTKSDPREKTVTNYYDDDDRVVRQTDAAGGDTLWDYRAGDTRVTDQSGVVTRTVYEQNVPVQVTVGFGTTDASTTRIDYDDDLNPEFVTDGDGKVWQYSYDAAGNQTRVKDPLGHTTIRTFDGDRNVTSVELPSGLRTTMDYEPDGDLGRVTTPNRDGGAPVVTEYDHNAHGEVVAATDPRGKVSTFDVDEHGYQDEQRSPLGNTTTRDYDVVGRLRSITMPRGHAPGGSPADFTTTITPNAFGEPEIITDAKGRFADLDYDAAGNLVLRIDRDGRTTRIDYDANNRPVKVTRGDGSFIRTGYDPVGRLREQIDALGKTTRYDYDGAGRLASVTDPRGEVRSMDYDGRGNVTSRTDEEGRTVTLSYDDAGRLDVADYESAAPGDVEYEYDEDGLLERMTDATGPTTYSYDAFNRLRLTSTPRGQIGYGYDLAGQLETIDYPTARTAIVAGAGGDPIATGTVTRGYDDDGRLVSVRDWLSHETTFGYDPDGNLTTVTRPNGTSSARAYDHDGSLTQITDSGPLGAFFTQTMTRSDEGLLASSQINGALAQALGYDDNQRLTSSGAYEYDAVDRITTMPSPAGAALTLNYEDGDRLTSVQQAGQTLATYTYDDLGQRTAVNPASGAASTTLSYDEAGQLVRYDGPDRTSAGALVTERYTYDGNGLRVENTSGDTTTQQVWDTAAGLSQLLVDGPTAYITGPDGLVIEDIGPSGQPRYYSHDQLGSTAAITNATGDVVETHRYDDYGNRTSSTQPTTPFGYAGQYTDEHTGLQYLRARYYDPTTGQFITRDPLVRQTRQAYAYASNNPANLTDPTGLGVGEFLDAVGNFTAGVGAGVTFGLSTTALNAIGVHPDTCSIYYTAGEVASLAVGAAGAGRLLYLGYRAMRASRAAKAGEEASRLGRTVSPLGRSYERYDSYLEDVAKHYGINLRGVKVIWDDSLGAGTLGKTRRAEGGWVIRVNRGHASEADLANTIAHELSHARDFQKGLATSEPKAYGAGNALEDWINGLR